MTVLSLESKSMFEGPKEPEAPAPLGVADEETTGHRRQAGGLAGL